MALGAEVLQSQEIGYFRTFIQPRGGRRREVTFFRGAATKVSGIRTADPFTDISMSLKFPQVTVFDTLGSGDLYWMQPDANVDVMWQNVNGFDYDWRFEGFLVSPTYVSNEAENSVSWDVKGALLQLDNYKAQPWFPSQPIPYEELIRRAFDGGRHPANLGPFRIEWPSNPIYGNIPFPENEMPVRDFPREEDQSPTQPTPGGGTTTPTPGGSTVGRKPNEILDLTIWKLNTPDGKETKGKALLSYTSRYFKATASGRGVVFTAPVEGTTTSGNTKYTRSELREMKKNGSEAKWSNKTGTHVMKITQAVSETPKKKPHVVIGQIHDAEDDVCVIRLEGNTLWMTDGDSTHHAKLDSDFELKKEFDIEFRCTPGKIAVYYNGKTKDAWTLKKTISGAYFKAGVYPQSNPSTGDKNPAQGVNVIYKLSVKHS